MRRFFDLLLAAAFGLLLSALAHGAQTLTTTRNIDCGSGASLDDMEAQGGAAGMSGSAWVRPTSYTSGARLLCKESASGGAGNWFFGWTVTNGYLRFGKDYATTDLDRIGNVALTLNVWSHVAFTWDGTATATGIHLYINGTESTYGTTTNGVGAKSADATQIFSIGGRADSTLGVAGQIEECAVWADKILTAQEILNLGSKVRRIPLQIASPEGYWPIDECGEGATCSGATVLDYSGNGNTGTPEGSPVGYSSQALNYPPVISSAFTVLVRWWFS